MGGPDGLSFYSRLHIDSLDGFNLKHHELRENMLGRNFNCCCWGQMSLRGDKDCGHFAVALSNLS